MTERLVSIVDHVQLLEVIHSLKHKNSDFQSRVAGLLKDLWRSNRPHKGIATNIDFELLKVAFPHFKEVIKYYQLQATISRRLNRPFTASPVLLLGDPGLGKTFFASELARLIALPYFEISLATATASFTISGASMQWAEGQPGFVLQSLAKSGVANPIILIDELDKTANNNKYDPIGPFYLLLEPHSASRFRDEALNLDVDASHVIWIATANEESKIPAPILSRFKTFHIKQPSPSEMLGVIDSIYSMLRNRNGVEELIAPELSLEVKNQLAIASPRDVRLSLDEAIMNAIFHERTELDKTDLPVTHKEERRFGFN